MISRTGGKSCVSSLAYRSATQLQDLNTGEMHDYRDKGFVDHVEILTPDDAPNWILEIAEECSISKQTALQKLSRIFESAEKRKDSQVYREVEFSLPNELTDEQNITWAKKFIEEVCVKKGMVAILNFHFDVDKKTGELKPHCHTLLSTREATEEGLALHKNLSWDQYSLVQELRQQCEQFQNLALQEHGFDVRVDHRSYADRGIDIDPQPKLGSAILDMAGRGLKTDKQANFDVVRLKNQFRILKDPELVFSIVTSNHSTFTRHDIARVLNRYIDDPMQFRNLEGRLLGSNNLIQLESREGAEAVYTTREMLGIEMNLVKTAEHISVQTTHHVDHAVVGRVIAHQNDRLAQYGGLSADQDSAIRHMLKGEQISCVVGYAGAGKTTSLEAAREAWEASGYNVVGLAPTGRAARNIDGSGIRSMTIHKFLLSQGQGREQISPKTVLVLDEAGMVDSRRFGELLSIVERAGAKIVAMGDGNQLQAIEAGPAFRLLTDRIHPAVLETVVRQQEDWQREATRLFGSEQAGKALSLYQEKGAFKIVEDKGPAFESGQLVDQYCLARQVSGRIWKEMIADYEQEHGKVAFDEINFEVLSQHQDFDLYQAWKGKRQALVEDILTHYSTQEVPLEERGIDTQKFGELAEKYKIAETGQGIPILREAESTLRIMSYENICDTRVDTKQTLVDAWAKHRAEASEQSHLMLAFTNRDTLSLNECARQLMREQGVITGKEFSYETQSIEQDDFGREVVTKQGKNFAKGDRLLFTHNNSSLDVKNGSLGTITSLTKNNIVVAMDGSEDKQVSFAPKLYPFIDHGWATNISKSQGVTVDHVKKLASFEEYRNLAYVGMSRHRHSLEIFGSSLDFWRKKKVVDRLSRVQEKLSGFDYLSGEKIEDLIKQDTEILWHQQKIQEGKDIWNAVKVTARDVAKGVTRDVVDQFLDRPLERSKEKITLDPLKSFEHSEEKRSSEKFKEKTLLADKAMSESLENTSNVCIIKETFPGMGEQATLPLKALEKQNSSQEEAVLTYLQQEVNPDKHVWLKEQYAQNLIESAKENPFEALKRWQKVSGDYSFDHSTPADPLTKDHEEIRGKILSYLKEEVSPEKHRWVDKTYSDNLLSMAEENPIKGLQKWREETKDYRFTTYRDTLSDREIRIQEYLQQQIVEEGDRFSKHKQEEVASLLIERPLEAYQRWYVYTGDKTFEPTSGIPRLETEAKELMSKVQDHVSPEVLKTWHENVGSSPESVLKECNEIIKAHQEAITIDSTAHNFVSLCEKYENMEWKDPRREKIDEAIQEITHAYLKDERFLEKIQDSQSKAATRRIELEIQIQQRSLSRGMGMEM